MVELLAILPILISLVFFAVVARRIHRIVTLVRDPERFGKGLAAQLEAMLQETGIDPERIRVGALRGLEALPPDERDAARVRLIRALLSGELDMPEAGTRVDPTPGSARFTMPGDERMSSSITEAPTTRPPPIDAGSRSHAPLIAIAVALIVLLVVAAMWGANGV